MRLGGKGGKEKVGFLKKESEVENKMILWIWFGGKCFIGGIFKEGKI